MEVRVKRFTGLYTQPNPLSLAPEGSLKVADDAVIDRDGAIENRRGFNFYGPQVFSGMLTALLMFKSTLVGASATSLYHDNGSGVFSAYSGNFSPLTGEKIRSQEQNGSLFFTTNAGVYKLDSLTGVPRISGIPKPLDITASFASTHVGSMPANSQVGYRMTWSRKDANNVTTEGAPSQRTDVINSYVSLNSIARSGSTATATTDGIHGYAVSDIITVLNADSYLVLSSLSQISSVATGTTAVAHGLTTGDTVVISGASPNDYNGTYLVASTPTATTFTFNITGDPTSPASGSIRVARDGDAYNGTFLLTAVTSTTFDYTLVGNPLSNAIAQDDKVMESGKDKDVTLTFTVPTGILAGDVFNVYRSEYSADVTITASDEMQLVYQGQYNSGTSVTITDVTTDDFKGADLYTNATQQGIAQSNDQPPLAHDITFYKNSIFYGNTQTKQNFDIQFLSPDNIVRNTDFVAVGSQSYTFSSIESTSAPFKFRLYADINGATVSRSGTVATITTSVAHGLAIGDTVFLSGAADNRFNDTFVVKTVPTSLTFTITVDNSGSTSDTVTVSTGSPAENIAATMQSLVHVINQTHPDIYAYYTSGPDDLPGGVSVVAKNLSFAQFNTISSVGTNFSPVLTTNKPSTNEAIANRLYYSKEQQPDSVPALNYFDIGPRDEKILRIVGLRDSLFIIKQRSIWRLAGEQASNFVVNLFDSSVALLALETVAVLNNTIYMYTNQGVVSVGDGGVEIISRPIEVDILPLASYPNAASTMFGVSYESERKYILFHQGLPTDTVPTAAYVYNTITRAWTRWTKGANSAIVVNDILYLGNITTNTVLKERKSREKTDKKDEAVVAAISAIDSTGKVLTITGYTYGGSTLSSGQLIEQGGKFAKVLSVVANVVTVDRNAAFNVAACTVANPIRLIWELLPQVVETPDMMKQFREVQAYPAGDTFSRATLYFASDLSKIQKTVDFAYLSREQGFGFTPWGLTPWGDVGELTGATPLRTYVPQGQQRCRGLIVGLRHEVAQEDIELLNVGYVFESNSERTTR